MASMMTVREGGRELGHVDATNYVRGKTIVGGVEVDILNLNDHDANALATLVGNDSGSFGEEFQLVSQEATLLCAFIRRGKRNHIMILEG